MPNSKQHSRPRKSALLIRNPEAFEELRRLNELARDLEDQGRAVRERRDELEANLKIMEVRNGGSR